MSARRPSTQRSSVRLEKPRARSNRRTPRAIIERRFRLPAVERSAAVAGHVSAASRRRGSSPPPFPRSSCVGELVLPETIRGMTEASTIRRPRGRRHPQPRVDDRERIVGAAHLRRADGMEDRRADVAGRRRELVLALRSAPGRIPPADSARAPARRRSGARAGSNRRRRAGPRASTGSSAGSPARRQRVGARAWVEPRLVGRRLQTLRVIAGKSCSGSPNRSSDSGCTWNSTLAVS